MLALDEPEALPKEGNLRGATMRTEMGTYHMRPFGQPCIEGFFGGSFARELEDAGDGAFAAQSIDEIAGYPRQRHRRKLKPLARVALGPRPLRARLLFHALPGHAGDSRVLAAPVDGRLFLREKRPRRTFSRRRMGQGTAGRGRRRKCWRLAQATE